jgi:hypothetical protein
MTNSSIARPDPLAAIIAFGKPSGPSLPQASWFKAEDVPAVKAAAGPLKFSVIELRTEADKALAIGVHEGVLKGSGRMIIGSVTPEVYRRIEEYARKPASADPAPKPESAAASSGMKASPEQNINTTSMASVSSAPGKPEPLAPPNPWEALRVGARVLAAYWNDKKEFEGFWLATVKRIDAGEFTLEWSEAPEYPAFKIPPKNVALVHPEFRPSGK